MRRVAMAAARSEDILADSPARKLSTPTRTRHGVLLSRNAPRLLATAASGFLAPMMMRTSWRVLPDGSVAPTIGLSSHHSRTRVIPLRNRHMRTSSSTQTTTMSRTTLRCSARVRVCALSRFAEVSATAYAAANCDEQSWVCWRAFTGVPI